MSVKSKELKKSLAAAATVMADAEDVISRLIPFAFENLDLSLVAKIKGVIGKIDKALYFHADAKDRAKEIRVIATKLGVDLNRKSESFLLIEAVAITIVGLRPEGGELIHDMSSFLQEFPEFSGLSVEEKNALLHYRNMMKVAIQVIPAKWNYNHLLALVAKISEGAKAKYVTGSGATDQTKYRMIIYEKVSGIPRQKRQDKKCCAFIGMLSSRCQDASRSSFDNNSTDETSSESDSRGGSNDSAIFHNFADLPVREKSVFVHSDSHHPGIMITSKESVAEDGTIIRSSSLTMKQEERSDGLVTVPSDDVELGRSASISTGVLVSAELDNLSFFENLHDDVDFSFLETCNLPSVQLNHQSVYDDSGSMIHDISVTEQMVDGSIINIPHPPSITHTNKNKAATRKRKAAAAATSNEDGDRIIRRISPNQEERYGILIQKLAEDIFSKEGTEAVDGRLDCISNEEFIYKVLKPKLYDLELLIAQEDTNANEVTKKMKIFASNLGVEPLSRFNDKFLIVEAALILLLSSRAEKQRLKVSFEEFMEVCPEFRSVEDLPEQQSLHAYRNMLAAALEIIPGKWNSNHLLDVVTRIVEGKDKKYVTGSGATKKTLNRIDIYHKLTGIEKVSKPTTFLNSVFQYLSDSNKDSSASSSDERGSNDAEERASFGESIPAASRVMSNFKASMKTFTTEVVDMNIKTDQFSLQSVPGVQVATTEAFDESISCKTTSVFREMKDAVTGNALRFELARGVSVTSSAHGFDLFNDFDIFETSNGFSSTAINASVERDQSEFDMACIAMLQENGQSGVQLHRSTAGTSTGGVIRNISLTRQYSRDNKGPGLFDLDESQEFLSLVARGPSREISQQFPLLSRGDHSSLLAPLNREHSLMPPTIPLVLPLRDHSLLLPLPDVLMRDTSDAAILFSPSRDQSLLKLI